KAPYSSFAYFFIKFPTISDLEILYLSLILSSALFSSSKSLIVVAIFSISLKLSPIFYLHLLYCYSTHFDVKSQYLILKNSTLHNALLGGVVVPPLGKPLIFSSFSALKKYFKLNFCSFTTAIYYSKIADSFL